MLFTLVRMEVEILEEKENKFLERKELKINLKHEKSATPSKSELLKELAIKFSAAEENISIDYILTKKGVGESLAKVKIYKGVKKKVGRSEAQIPEAK